MNENTQPTLDPGLDAASAEILGRMTDDDWLVVFHALVLYACKRCAGHRRKRLFWRTGKVLGRSDSRNLDEEANLPDGFSPKAIAQEAIARLFSGKRKWNREEYPGENPLKFLEGTVDSIVSDLVRSDSHKTTAYLHDEETKRNDDGLTYAVDKLDGGGRASFGSELQADPEEKAYFSDVFARIQSAVSDREDLTAYFGFLTKGLQRSEIAASMKVSPARVSELRKQFLERTRDICREVFGEEVETNVKQGGAGGAS